MPKLIDSPQLPRLAESQEMRQLQQALTPLLGNTARKVNAMASGRAVGRDEAATAAPTTGSYQQGDEVFNSTPTELGAAGSRYVVIGFKCIASGTPGTWVQMRVLTGN